MVKKQDVRKDQSSGQATLRQTALPNLFPHLFAGPMKNRYGTTLPPPSPLPVSQTRTVYTRSESKQTARPIASFVMGKTLFFVTHRMQAIRQRVSGKATPNRFPLSRLPIFFSDNADTGPLFSMP